jgi:ATP-dependent Clp protease ATP-binding subunit ClpC
LRRAIQREIEDSLSEKILYGELKAGQIVLVDAEGTGENTRFSFHGASKSGAIPDLAPTTSLEKGAPPVAAGDDVATG